MPPSRDLAPPAAKRQFLERATNLAGIPRAFRPDPLSNGDMQEFYSDSLNKQRGNQLLREIQANLVDSADQGFFFKGAIYGNRGSGKSTEINRLLETDDIQRRFLVIRLDALSELNPQTFSVVDVVVLVLANLIERCHSHCEESGTAFTQAGIMAADLQQILAPFFPELQDKVQTTDTKGGGGELGFLSSLKLSVRIEGTKKIDPVSQRKKLTELTEALERQITVCKQSVPDLEFLIVGENFDKEQIAQELLHDAFVQYASVLRELRLHMLFTLPVPFVHSFTGKLAFRGENCYPFYDIPVCDEAHRRHAGGCNALLDLMAKRADLLTIFADDALESILRASGGDLYRLFAITIKAGLTARFRHEDHPATADRVLRADVEAVVNEQLGIFRNELGTAPNDPDETSWETKQQKLRGIYEGDPNANVPDPALYQLIRRRAVLFFNGRGRYGVHPLAVEVLKEQLGDAFYRGGGLDLRP